MAYNFVDRLRWTDRRMAQFNDEPLTLTRDGDSTLIRGSKILRNVEEMSDGGGIVSVEYQDFGINVSQYIIAGITVLPKEGDRFTNALGEIFQVIELGGEVFKFTTSKRKRYLIHTTQVQRAT